MTVVRPYFCQTFSEVNLGIGEHQLIAAPADIEAIVRRGTFASTAAAAHVLLATTVDIEASVRSGVFTSAVIAAHTLAASPADIDASVAKGLFSSVSVDEVILTATRSDIEGLIRKGTFASVLGEEAILSSTTVDLSAEVKKGGFSSVSGEQAILSATAIDLSAAVAAGQFTSQVAGEVILQATAGDIEGIIQKGTFASAGIATKILSATSADLSGTVVAGTFTSQTIGAAVLNATPGDLEGVVRKGAFSSQNLGEQVLVQMPVDILSSVRLGSFVSQTLAAHVVPASPVDIDAQVAKGTFTSQSLAAHVLTARRSDIDAIAIEGTFSSEAPVGEAVCFLGTGYLAAENLPGYLTTETAGYVAVWYKYDGGDAGEPIGLEFVNTIFMAQRSDESLLEFRIQRFAQFQYPELVIEQNDDRFSDPIPTEVIGYTNLEADGGPNIRDGNWHLLMWANDNLGAGWTFFVDGQRYFLRGGTNRGDWFSQVQANIAAGDFEEIDIAARRVPSPDGEDFLYGCIDELMVVRGRPLSQMIIDAEYLWNSGNGKLIPTIETQNLSGLWDDTYNAWEFRSGGGATLGDEYRNPDGDGRHDLEGTGFVQRLDGIPG